MLFAVLMNQVNLTGRLKQSVHYETGVFMLRSLMVQDVFTDQTFISIANAKSVNLATSSFFNVYVPQGNVISIKSDVFECSNDCFTKGQSSHIIAHNDVNLSIFDNIACTHQDMNHDMLFVSISATSKFETCLRSTNSTQNKAPQFIPGYSSYSGPQGINNKYYNLVDCVCSSGKGIIYHTTRSAATVSSTNVSFTNIAHCSFGLLAILWGRSKLDNVVVIDSVGSLTVSGHTTLTCTNCVSDRDASVQFTIIALPQSIELVNNNKCPSHLFSRAKRSPLRFVSISFFFFTQCHHL